jgi:hypothetical protein
MKERCWLYTSFSMANGSGRSSYVIVSYSRGMERAKRSITALGKSMMLFNLSLHAEGTSEGLGSSYGGMSHWTMSAKG